jgi:hypothetical protein
MFSNDPNPKLLNAIAQAAGVSVANIGGRLSSPDLAAADGLSMMVVADAYAASKQASTSVRSPTPASPPKLEQPNPVYYAILAEQARAHLDRAPAQKSGASTMTTPMIAAELQADIVAEWRDKPQVRGEFSSFGAYTAYRENDFCKKNGLRREALKGALVDVDAHVASLNQARRSRGEAEIQPFEVDAIRERAKTWEASPDLRAEFGSFGAFDSYSRWHKAGRVKHYGAGRLT